MKDKQLVPKIAKFGSKLVLKFTGLELLGEGGIFIYELGSDFLPEQGKNFIDASIDSVVDAFSDEAGNYAQNYLNNRENLVNFHLARGICEVWEKSLIAHLPENKAENSRYFILPQNTFQWYDEQFRFLIGKLRESQQLDKTELLTELFYDETKSPKDFYNTYFTGIQTQESAEKAYWNTLSKTLFRWLSEQDKIPQDWKNEFPQDFEKELKKVLFENLRIGLKDIFNRNENFRNSFSFSVDLEIYHLVKTLHETFEEKIEKSQSDNRFNFAHLRQRLYKLELNILDKIPRAVQEAVNAAFDSTIIEKINENNHDLKIFLKLFKDYYYAEVDYSSPELKKAVLDYLYRIKAEATVLGEIYPEEFNNKAESFFHKITQRFQVVRKLDFDRYKAGLTEKNRLKGDKFTPANIIPTAEKYSSRNLQRYLPDEKENWQLDANLKANEKIEIYEWDTKTQKKFKRNVILGDPGLGKSWLLKFEAYKLAGTAIQKLEKADDISDALKEIEIPIHLQVSTIAANASDIKELIVTIAELAGTSQKIERYKKELINYLIETISKRQKAILLLDALDEVPDDIISKGFTRKKFAGEFSKFAGLYRQNSILITSRKVNYEIINLYDSPEKDNINLEILPFDQTQIKNYAAVWFGEDSDTTNSFLNLINEKRQVAGLFENPLMLSLMCRLFYQRNENFRKNGKTIGQTGEGYYFPNTRCGIYKSCLWGFLKEWKDTKKGQIPIKESFLRIKLAKLEKIAFNLFLRNKQQFSSEEFQRALYEKFSKPLTFEELENSADFLEDCKTDGILVEITQDENPQYRFIHLTFQEFLAASHLAKNNEWDNFAINNRQEFVIQPEILFDGNWQEVLSLLGGTLLDEATAYIQKLIEINGDGGKNDMLFRPYTLAISASAEAGSHLPETYKENLWAECVEKYKQPPVFLTGNLFKPALQALERSILDDFLEKFTSKETQFPEKKKLIKKIKGRFSDKEQTLSAFIKLLKDRTENEEIRLEIAEAISYNLNISRIATDELIKFLENPAENIIIKQRVASLLSQKKLSQEQIIKVFSILKNSDENILIRKIITDIFCNQANLPVVILDNLIHLLNNRNENQDIRKTLASIFRHRADLTFEIASKLINLHGKTDDFFLKTILEDITVEIKSILYSLPDERPVSELVKTLKNPARNIFLRRAIVEKLCNQPNLADKIIIDLAEILTNTKENKIVRGAVAYFLRNRSNLSNKLIVYINEILKNDGEDNFARLTIAEALRRQSNSLFEISFDLITILQNRSEDIWIRRTVAEIFSNQLNLPGKITYELIKILKNKSEDRFLLLTISKAIGSQSKSPVENPGDIIKIITDKSEDDFPRQIFAETLRNSNLTSEQSAALIEILKNSNEDYDLKLAIARILSNQRNISVKLFDDVIKIFKNNRDENIRKELLELLSHNIEKIKKQVNLFEIIRDDLKNSWHYSNYYKELEIYTLKILAERFKIAVPLNGEITL